MQSISAIAKPDDAEAISDLLLANTRANGGALYGDWRLHIIKKWIESDDKIIVTKHMTQVTGVLLTSSLKSADAPVVKAMLEAWPGQPGDYVYGPVCIDNDFRGNGLLAVLSERAASEYPGRKGILFIHAANERSLRAHEKCGMQRVAGFTCDGQNFWVLTTA